MNRTKKIAMLIATTACSAILAVVSLFNGGLAKVNADTAIGGEKKTVEVTSPSSCFKDWGNENATYGVGKNGVWRKDNATGETNRQAPISDSLTLSTEKDAYLTFALPVYNTDGSLLSDKVAAEVIMSLTNNKGAELQIKFLTADKEHPGMNYCVSKTPLGGWTGYWTSKRMAGDFTADNFITLKFADRAGENIAVLEDGAWYADAGINHENVAAFFAGATSLSVNFTYWAKNCTADTNFEFILHDFDGTVYTDKIEQEKPDVVIGGEKKTVEVTDPSEYFYDWGNANSKYGVSENGIWRKDSTPTGDNRQFPMKEKLSISKTKDAYLSFAIPVYDTEGKLLSDKLAMEVLMNLQNDRGQQLKIKFLTADKENPGMNYCVAYTPATEWNAYWTSKRMVGDFTADNFITMKFADRAGENISVLDGENWYADSGLQNDNVAAFFTDAKTIQVNFTYWAENLTADTNFEVILHDFDGTVYTNEVINENDCYLNTIGSVPEVTFNGKTVSVPAAKGYFGKNEVDATVLVSDSDENAVTLNDGAFTAQTGVYTIKYTAEYNGKTVSEEYTLTVYSGNSVMDVSETPDDYFRGWISGPSVWDENGLTSIDNYGYDSAAGHQRQSFYQADFNIENGKSVTMTVSIPIYDAQGNKLPNRLNRAENGIDWVDMMLVDIDKSQEFRIRMKDGFSRKNETEFFGSFYSGDPYASSENWGGWISRPANTKMKGTFTQESSFTFRITGVENEHFQVIAPDGTWKSVGSASDVTDDMYSLTLALNTFFKTTKNIRVGFYYWATSNTATENDNLAVTYKNINGQTFIPVDGKVADEIKPVVGAAVPNTKEKVFTTGSNYIFGVSFVDEVFENVAARKLVYRKKGTTEWKETGVFDKDSNKITSCKFEDFGTMEIAVKAVDFAGNVGYGEITEVVVEKGYDITVDGTVPAEGEVGKKITLPSASASDKNGVARDVTISVEDASGKIIKMDSANSFTAEKAGKYYIIYTSSYKDGDKTVSTKKEFTITVKTASQPSESSKDQGCGSSVSLMGLSSLIVIAGAAFIVKKKND